ncbi:ParB N-terminal domain-containing protein [Kineosporia succinea]|uniref:ParB-like nuclease family protein n=1 Tax=Kineosporia succinea TaxID=84632 RepID=A0ABT9PA92_9ACTN|nr:hypothetical protein [Kineosporia succinea]MDP9829334.1 hypothetical protein [Kineosporia succinea]
MTIFASIAQDQVTVENISPKEAASLLGTQVRNRPLNRARVDQYAGDMEAGRWRRTKSVISVDRDGHLIDGQHRLTAVILSGSTQEFIVSRGHDPEDQMYMDLTGVRTPPQQMAMMGSRHASRQSTVAKHVLAYDTGVMQASPGNRGGGRYPGLPAIIEFQKKHEEDILWAIDLVLTYGIAKTAFGEAALMSTAFLITRATSKPEVESFWDEWLNPEHATSSNAILRLARLNPGEYKKEAASGQICALLHAWNDYRSGRERKQRIMLKRAGQWIAFPERILP